MSNAIVLFRRAGQDEWVSWRTVEFDNRKTKYETVQCGFHAVDLQHAAIAGLTLLLTDGDTRVVVWPTGGNEPGEDAPKTMYDLPFVGHYDVVEPEKGTYRIYHERHRKERKW
ncbi:hypothetical protein HY339_00725 [Candidatus Gottesmanbacteria bacterium]|nr:hypothetical protein [Candidatus Gottesmanbacteria bacterium]